MHVITGLGRGGAEMMLWKLLRRTDGRFSPVVVTLMEGGELAKNIRESGVPVHALGMARGRVSLSPLFALARLIRRMNPAVIIGWMYHPSIASLLAKWLARSPASLIWNIRHTPYDLRSEKALTTTLIRAGAFLSRFPSRIIYNSHVSRDRHTELGFDSAQSVVIPNGFDLDEFDASAEKRARIRAQLGIPAETPIVGHVARFHPMKAHESFFQSAHQISDRVPGTRFVMVGRDVSSDNAEIARMLASTGLAGKALLLGERSDVVDLLCAFDVFCLSSAWGEGFPNTLGEAMACGVPCVTTDVGDAAMVVGETGRIVPKNAPPALADAVCELLLLSPSERRALGMAGRRRIAEQFSLADVSLAYRLQIADLIDV
jgi:glycosyltransferase involved in cell wall biosynthesis